MRSRPANRSRIESSWSETPGSRLPDDPTLAAIGRWAVPQERAAVVLLGDNLYPDGLAADDRARG